MYARNVMVTWTPCCHAAGPQHWALPLLRCLDRERASVVVSVVHTAMHALGAPSRKRESCVGTTAKLTQHLQHV